MKSALNSLRHAPHSKTLQQKREDGSKSINESEPDFKQVTNIEPPKHLGPQGKAIWESYAPELCRTRVMRATDIHNLEAFCNCYQAYREAQSELSKEGPVIVNQQGNLVKNPAATVVNEQLRLMAMYGSMLGLDPLSRQRLVAEQPQEETNPFNSL